jgi:DNA-binding transcriptional MerR regulator
LQPGSAVEAGLGAPALKIGQVAQCTGLTVKTIRFYCDQGLIEPVGRSEGGYRLFDQRIVEELELIRTLKTLDVSLPEMRQILAVRRSGRCNCSSVKGSVQSRITMIERRIAELQAMELELTQILRSWQDCGGIKPASADPQSKPNPRGRQRATTASS